MSPEREAVQHHSGGMCRTGVGGRSRSHRHLCRICSFFRKFSRSVKNLVARHQKDLNSLSSHSSPSHVALVRGRVGSRSRSHPPLCRICSTFTIFHNASPIRPANIFLHRFRRPNAEVGIALHAHPIRINLRADGARGPGRAPPCSLFRTGLVWQGRACGPHPRRKAEVGAAVYPCPRAPPALSAFS
jgi:hypothetical protein